MTSQKTAGGRPPEADGRTGPRPETESEPVPRDHGRALLRPVVAFALLAAVALVLGVWSLTRVDPGKISDVGLISAFPPTYYVALALSLIGFVGSVRLRRLLPALLAWQLVVLVVILHGADPIVHGLPRLEASYRHLGIANYIAQSGHLDPTLDAYFNWPGFFGLLGMLADATGVHDLTALATWAPLGVNLLLMPALVALVARLTNNSSTGLDRYLAVLFRGLGGAGLSLARRRPVLLSLFWRACDCIRWVGMACETEVRSASA